MHFNEDASEGPHVDRQIVGKAEQYFGRSIEAGLNVLVYLKKTQEKQLAQLVYKSLRVVTLTR